VIAVRNRWPAIPVLRRATCVWRKFSTIRNYCKTFLFSS